MTRLPPKKDVALALLEQATVLVHLDPRGEQVQVPDSFKRNPQLVLQIGLNMPKPIVDLRVDDDGISCTLSFNNTPHFCRLPWSAVYALIGANHRGMVWPDDVPKEVQGQYVMTTPKEEPKPRAALRAVGPAPAPAPEEQAAKVDAKKKKRARKAKEAKETEKVMRATRTPKKRPVVVAAPALAPERTPARAPAPVPAAASPARRASGGTSTAGAKKKRELPPYLRIVK